MNNAKLVRILGVALFVSLAIGTRSVSGSGWAQDYGVDPHQVSRWNSADDLEFFLHGSLSTEIIPERVFRTFLAIYPVLYPGGDLSVYGVNVPEGEDLPLGFSRRKWDHLGGQVSVGINCASCHVAEVHEHPGADPIRVLGCSNKFDVFSFIGSIAVAMSKTSDPANMEKFLREYLKSADPEQVEAELSRQKDVIAQTIAAMGSEAVSAGMLHEIAPSELEGDLKNLVPLVRALLKLFQNIRTALHLPEQLPPPPKAVPGPGRNDAFNLLAAAFFGIPPQYEAPCKFGMAWNLWERKWVHWDGNCDQPMARNLAAVMGLGCPTVGAGKLLDLASVERHTALSEQIRSPRYPWEISQDRAARGARIYQENCARCHEASEENRLFSLEEIGTDPNRLLLFDEKAAELFNQWTRGRKVKGHQPAAVSWRATKKYWASDMRGAWARSPYLHNGSVRTMWDLLTDPAQRPRTFRIGLRVYDKENMGYIDEGNFTFDTSLSGNSNAGHDYGTDLADEQKRDLIEFIKRQ